MSNLELAVSDNCSWTQKDLAINDCEALKSKTTVLRLIINDYWS